MYFFVNSNSPFKKVLHSLVLYVLINIMQLKNDAVFYDIMLRAKEISFTLRKLVYYGHHKTFF